MSPPLEWDRDGRDWPHRTASRFVDTSGLRWHVQVMGSGPTVLLLHGTGASAHSWRGVMSLLAEHFTVIAPDLPGHGFTRGQPRGGLSLPGMVGGLTNLLDTLGLTPALVVGHSAGVAIGLALLAEGDPAIPLVGFNPAIAPFPGLAAKLFPALAKALFVNPFAPRIFSRIARVRGETERFLVRSTGSRIDAEGLRCYAVLLGNARHCRGALDMMASWDLERLDRALPGVANPALLVHSDGDSAIPLASVRKAAARLPQATLEVVPKLGHLAHEEDPGHYAHRVLDFARSHGI
jgi:magnesium chelatase accessory protein